MELIQSLTLMEWGAIATILSVSGGIIFYVGKWAWGWIKSLRRGTEPACLGAELIEGGDGRPRHLRIFNTGGPAYNPRVTFPKGAEGLEIKERPLPDPLTRDNPAKWGIYHLFDAHGILAVNLTWENENGKQDDGKRIELPF